MSKIWKDILLSIKGTEQDYTVGSIKRAILLLSVPMILEMVMESVFAVADIFFVSKLGAEAVATVGLTESLMTLIYAVGVGLSMATTGIVARRIGEKNVNKASVAAIQSIIIGIFFSVLIAIPGYIFAKDILRLMGGDESLVRTGNMYTGIMMGGNIVIMLLFINNAIFRSAGDAAISMRVLWVANILNIILDPCFIFGLGPFPEMGVTGAAVATNIGRGIAVIYQFYLLGKGNARIKIVKENIVINVKVIVQLLKLSIGGIGQFIIANISWIGLYRIMAEFGSEVIAGYTIAIRIIIFSLLPSWGMSNAAATLVGQNLGAKQPERAEKSVWITGFVNMIFLIAIGLLFYIFPHQLVSLFSNEEAIIKVAVLCLRIICLGYVFYAFGMVMANAFNGAGDTTTPTVLNIICFWFIEIPLAYFLSKTLNMDHQGVFMAIVIAESMLGILGILVFKRGKWKTRII
ncbi:MAG: MATE family efflux transporter [Bacteroidales bacterium]|nr:MATE family efflux transporter [Bacteroidales bacterium]